jgi:hypothetical protein
MQVTPAAASVVEASACSKHTIPTPVPAAKAPVEASRSKLEVPFLAAQTALFPTADPRLRWSTKNGSWFKMDNLVLFVVTWVFLLVRLKPRYLPTPPI